MWGLTVHAASCFSPVCPLIQHTRSLLQGDSSASLGSVITYQEASLCVNALVTLLRV